MLTEASHHHTGFGLALFLGLVTALAATAVAIIRIDRNRGDFWESYGEWEEYLGI